MKCLCRWSNLLMFVAFYTCMIQIFFRGGRFFSPLFLLFVYLIQVMLHAAVTFLVFPVILYECVWGIADIVQNFFSNFLKPPYSLGHSVYLYSYLFFAHSVIVIIWDVPNSVRRFFMLSSVFLTRCRAARQQRWTCDPSQHQSGTPCESWSCFVQSCVTLLCFIFIFERHPLRQQIWVPAARLAFPGTRSAAPVFPFSTSKYLQSFYELKLYFSERRWLCLRPWLTF